MILIGLQMIITSWAIVCSLAGAGSLGKVEKLKHQGEKEKTSPSHPQRNQSGVNTMWMDWGEEKDSFRPRYNKDKCWMMIRF